MQVTAVGAGQTSSTTETTDQLRSLGKEDFLKLLVAQLQYQDPLSPTDTGEFMGQLSQMGSLEEMQNLRSVVESFASADSFLSATGLIGKKVTYQDTTLGSQQQGLVESVEVLDGSIQVNVGGKALSLSDILAVEAGSA